MQKSGRRLFPFPSLRAADVKESELGEESLHGPLTPPGSATGSQGERAGGISGSRTLLNF